MGVEAVQEAFVAAHEHHGRSADLGSTTPDFLATTALRLLRHVVLVTVSARPCTAEGGRQVAVAAINGRADVGRLRIDDMADDGTLQLGAELVARFGTVTSQIQHQRTAVLVILAGPLDQLALGLVRHAPGRFVFGTVPVKGRSCWAADFSGPHVHGPVDGLGQTLQNTPLQRSLLAVGIHCIGLQVPRPVLGLVRGHEFLVVGLQRARGHGHPGRGSGTAGDLGQDAGHLAHEAGAVAHVDVLAMAVDGCMPQIVDGGGRAGLHLGGP